MFKRRVGGTAAGCFFKHDIPYHISIILEDFLEQLINCTHSSKDLHLRVSNVKIKLSQLCRTSIPLLVTTSQFLRRRNFLHIFLQMCDRTRRLPDCGKTNTSRCAEWCICLAYPCLFSFQSRSLFQNIYFTCCLLIAYTSKSTCIFATRFSRRHAKGIINYFFEFDFCPSLTYTSYLIALFTLTAVTRRTYNISSCY